jgi:acyl-CoA hydrolase
MKVEVSVELDSEDLKKDKKLTSYVMKMLAKQSKEKKKSLIEEMPDDEEMDD